MKRRAPAKKRGLMIGIDEAGRGPLAGPVAVGAFAARAPAALRRFRGVKDSKQLSERQREAWFSAIEDSSRKGESAFEVSFSGAAVIDARGIVRAVRAAMDRCLRRLERRGFAAPSACAVLLDGSLYAPARYPDQTTIIDGDATEPIIALASICAKVLRDRKMKRLAEKRPGYGFEVHKGYGTKAHYEALRKRGPTPEHRRSFLKGLGAGAKKM
ncbi:MAG: ribonuclease HII [Patescibacteria group bacterium]|nr:ribonuclease HII [Patescibacteria group bacterium]